MATALLFACTADLFAQITWHGTGTKDNPYLIESADHFRAINTRGLNAYYKQTDAIDLGTITADSTTHAYVIGSFKGNYDGNGKWIKYQISIKINHKINGQDIVPDENKDRYIGLFDSLSGSAVVKNLTIKESNISFTRNESGGNSSIPRYQKYIKRAKKRISVINAEIAQLQAEITELNKQFEDRLKDREKFMQYLDSVAVRKNVDSDGYSAGNADGLIAEARLFATMHKTIQSYGKNGKNGVYQDTIKDLTNKANVQVTYDATRKRYLVGPFRFQYMEVYSSTSYGDSESGNQGNQFAGITGVPTLSVQIYKDGRNQVEDWELGEGWTFSWEGNERSNIDSLGGSIPDQYDSYPHTGEEFYILMDYKEGMHKLGGLTFDFRCLTANGTYHYSSGYIDKWSWTAGSVSFGECDHSDDHYKWNEEKKIWEYDYTSYCDYYTSATISVSKKKVGTIATQKLMRVE